MEIRGPGNVPQPPQGPQGPDKADKAGKSDFKDALRPGQAGAAGGAAQGSPADAVIRPNFQRLSERIQDGVSKNHTKQEILQDVVDDQLKEQFGGNASKEMTEAVTDKFRNDPQLSQLFNRIYSQATTGRE